MGWGWGAGRRREEGRQADSASCSLCWRGRRSNRPRSRALEGLSFLGTTNALSAEGERVPLWGPSLEYRTQEAAGPANRPQEGPLSQTRKPLV